MKKSFIIVLVSFFLWSCNNYLVLKERHIPASQEPVEVSFASWEEAILLEVEINGENGIFLFDNGFSKSTISPQFAEKAKIKFDRKSSVTDLNSKTRTLPLTKIDIVNIKGQTFANTEFYLLDTKVFSPCRNIDGIIGASIINLINWEIDYTANTIKLSSTPFKNDGIKMGIEFSNNNSSFTTITLNGINVKTKIDFGNTSEELSLNLEHTSKYFKNFEVIEKIGTKSISAHGLGNPITFYQLADKINITTNEKILPIKTKVSLVENLKHGGYLGASYFSNYKKVTINSTHQEYILSGVNYRKNPSFKEIKSYGLSLYLVENTLKVIQLNRRNPLLNDINIYDEVVLLDDKPISIFKDICEYKDYIETKKQNEEVLKITVKNSSSYHLQLKEPIIVELK